jgi:hypothetical protein
MKIPFFSLFLSSYLYLRTPLAPKMLRPTVCTKIFRGTALHRTLHLQNDFSTSKFCSPSHDFDQHVGFDHVSHTYTFKEQPIKFSVTQLISRYFESFNSEVIALKMMSSFNWPRPEYQHPDGEPYSLQEILAKWNQISEDSRNQGTLMHENIEKMINNGMIIPDSITSSEELLNPETKQFISFMNDILIRDRITPYRTEWKIVAPNINLAGSVDFIGMLPALPSPPAKATFDTANSISVNVGDIEKKSKKKNVNVTVDDQPTFVIMDWKRTKYAESFFKFNPKYGTRTSFNNSNSDTTTTTGFPLKRAKRPISNLYDCDEIKYSLQLNFYNYILTNYYSLKISKMMIVAFHPELSNYVAHEVPNLQNEVHEIICDLISNQ